MWQFHLIELKDSSPSDIVIQMHNDDDKKGDKIELFVSKKASENIWYLTHLNTKENKVITLPLAPSNAPIYYQLNNKEEILNFLRENKSKGFAIQVENTNDQARNRYINAVTRKLSSTPYFKITGAYAAFGALVGCLALPFGPLIGAAIGAAIGALQSFDQSIKNRDKLKTVIKRSLQDRSSQILYYHTNPPQADAAPHRSNIHTLLSENTQKDIKPVKKEVENSNPHIAAPLVPENKTEKVLNKHETDVVDRAAPSVAVPTKKP